jgi:hypothetical protein
MHQAGHDLARPLVLVHDLVTGALRHVKHVMGDIENFPDVRFRTPIDEVENSKRHSRPSLSKDDGSYYAVPSSRLSHTFVLDRCLIRDTMDTARPWSFAADS